MTKEKLKEYMKIKRETALLAARLEDLAANVYSVKAITVNGAPKSRMKGAATGDFSELLVKLIDMKEIYGRKLNELIDARKEIEMAIEGFTGEEQALVRARYIDGLPWEGVAEELKCGRSEVFRIHAVILDRLI